MSDPTPPPAAYPPSQPNVRLMKAIVIVLGVLILLAFIALIVGFVMRLNGHAPGSANTTTSVYALPAHSRIMSMQIVGSNRILLGLVTPNGSEIDIFDTDNGKLVSKIEVPGGKW